MNTMYLGPDFIDEYIEEARSIRDSSDRRFGVKITIDIAPYIFPVIERYCSQHDDIMTIIDDNTILIKAV